MDWQLILTAVGTGAAIAAAIFSLPAFLGYLRRPRLELRARGRPNSRQSGTIWFVDFQLELRKHGERGRTQLATQGS
jgi:hypothetical protein